jgi:hypothetical protein
MVWVNPPNRCHYNFVVCASQCLLANAFGVRRIEH